VQPTDQRGTVGVGSGEHVEQLVGSGLTDDATMRERTSRSTLERILGLAGEAFSGVARGHRAMLTWW
jgi:hypothetical protein